MVLDSRRKVQTYFTAISLKKSLAKPDDFLHYKSGKSWQRCLIGSVLPFPQLYCGPVPGRPKPARLTEPGRVHVRCAQRIAYTRPA
jgi:hypothetical protein